MAVKLPPLKKLPKIEEEGDRTFTKEEIKGFGYTLPPNWGLMRKGGAMTIISPVDITGTQLSKLISEKIIDIPGDEFKPSMMTTLGGVAVPIEGFVSNLPIDEMIKGVEELLAGGLPPAKRLMAERELANLRLQFGGLPGAVRQPGLPLPTKEDLPLIPPSGRGLGPRLEGVGPFQPREVGLPPAQRGFEAIFPERDIAEVRGYYFLEVPDINLVPPAERIKVEEQQRLAVERFDEFLAEIQQAGRTPETEEFLMAFFPGITQSQIAQIFTPPGIVELEGEEPLPIAPMPDTWEGSLEAWVEEQIGRQLSFGEILGSKPIPELGNKKWTQALANSIRTGGNLPRDIPYISILEGAKVFGESLSMLPDQIAVAFLQATQGKDGASVVNKDWADKFIQEKNEDYNKFIQRIAREYPDSVAMETFATASQNLAFSLLSMGAGLAVGVPIAFVPVPGARVAAYTSGSAASGFVAYRMTTYQIMQQYLEMVNEDKIARTGKGLTLEEENKLKEEFSDKAHQYGLWEAIPEAISNLAFIKLLGPLKNVVGKYAPKIIRNITGIYGTELITETITQKGQAGIEVAAGLRAEDISWTDAFKEIAPQTFLLTTIMAGAGGVVIKTTSAVQRVKDSLKKEIGENNPMYPELEQIIDEQLGQAIQDTQVTKEAPEIAVVAPTQEALVEEAKIASTFHKELVDWFGVAKPGDNILGILPNGTLIKAEGLGAFQHQGVGTTEQWLNTGVIRVVPEEFGNISVEIRGDITAAQKEGLVNLVQDTSGFLFIDFTDKAGKTIQSFEGEKQDIGESLNSYLAAKPPAVEVTKPPVEPLPEGTQARISEIEAEVAPTLEAELFAPKVEPTVAEETVTKVGEYEVMTDEDGNIIICG